MTSRRTAPRQSKAVKNAADRVLSARAEVAVQEIYNSRKRMVPTDRRRSLFVAGSIAILVAIVLAGGYGVHQRMVFAAEQAALRAAQFASALKAELRTGTVLFVPLGGNVCRRRVIDNATWTMRDGGQVICDRAVSWNANMPDPEQFLGMRSDAMRASFGQRNTLE
jgi:hypothetical protein